MKRYIKSSQYMTEQDVKERYGKSIWDMTPEELVKHNLDELWCRLIDAEADDSDDEFDDEY